MQRRLVVGFCIGTAIAVALVAAIMGVVIDVEQKGGWAQSSPVVPAVAEATLASCIATQMDAITPASVAGRSDQFVNENPVLIHNATLWTGVAEGQDIFEDYSLLIEAGKIVAVGADLPVPDDADVIDAMGRIVSPGLIDVHSHFGVHPWPELFGNFDWLELQFPITSFVRAVDGFNPDDPAIAHLRRFGVTSSQIFPASSVMSGDGFQVKLLDSHDVTDLIIPVNFRTAKMATGDNAKRYFGDEQDIMPSSRMGTAWLYREAMDKAKKT